MQKFREKLNNILTEALKKLEELSWTSYNKHADLLNKLIFQTNDLDNLEKMGISKLLGKYLNRVNITDYKTDLDKENYKKIRRDLTDTLDYLYKDPVLARDFQYAKAKNNLNADDDYVVLGKLLRKINM